MERQSFDCALRGRSGFAVVCTTRVLIFRLQACILAGRPPTRNFPERALELILQSVDTGAQFRNGLVRQQLLKRPFLNVARLVILKLCYVLDAAL